MTLSPGFFARPFAHRALHGPGRPENSLAAIEAACQAGWCIEIDVQLSADGAAMVFHDYDMARLTGVPGPIQQSDQTDLSRLRLVGGEDASIPSLSEALEIIAGRVPLVVEIKDQDGAMGPDIGPLEQAVAETLGEYDGPVAVMSFNPHSVAEMHRLAPDLPRGLVTSAFTAEDWPLLPHQRREELSRFSLEGLDASFISHDVAGLTMPRVAELKTEGLAVLCWTVRSIAQEREARQVADQITFEGYTPG